MKLRRFLIPVIAKFQCLWHPFMAEKKASKEHKAPGHTAIAQSHFSLPQFERESL